MPPRSIKRIPPLGPGLGTARQRVVAQWRGIDLAPIEFELHVFAYARHAS